MNRYFFKTFYTFKKIWFRIFMYWSVVYTRKYDNSNTKFKTLMIRSNLCDYSDTYILVKETIIVPYTAAAGSAVNDTNKKVILKNCAAFTYCITEINST